MPAGTATATVAQLEALLHPGDPWPDWMFKGWLQKLPPEQKLRLWRRAERDMAHRDEYPYE